MTQASPTLAIARADFLERVRSYGFLLTLLFAVYLGYATATGQLSMQLDEYRGVYTSGWIGTLVALTTTCFASLVGFYIVKNSVQRDWSTGVGQILAATTLKKTAYAFGKFLSNFSVLALMVAVLALGAVVMQFLIREDPRVDLWALLAPSLLISLPAMALTAGIAVFFEMVPILKGGVGNVIWFFVWSFAIALPALTGVKWLDPLAVFTVMNSLAGEAQRYIPGYHGGMAFQINLGQIKVAHDLRWPGVAWSWDLVSLRLMWFAVAACFALIASVVFDRFDSERAIRGTRRKPERQVTANLGTVGVTAQPPIQAHLTPLSLTARSSAFARILVAELRLALQGLRWWWYAVAAGLLIAQFFSPLEVSRGPLLGAAWIWPILVWSAMGSRESRFTMRPILFSCANIVPRQVLACWLAGVTVALVTGSGAATRLLMARQFDGLLALVAGALFIPALALSLGVFSGSGKFFEALFTMLWYVGPMNKTPGLDFTGAANGPRTLHDAFVYAALGTALLAVAFVGRARQLRSN
ncbi:MAG TPA: hypothetical protein VEI73_12705 [Candidatus Acidoferrum sp.]|nr:hypothetical protein [Candidatus Acidoferrum sp.]